MVSDQTQSQVPRCCLGRSVRDRQIAKCLSMTLMYYVIKLLVKQIITNVPCWSVLERETMGAAWAAPGPCAMACFPETACADLIGYGKF